MHRTNQLYRQVIKKMMTLEMLLNRFDNYEYMGHRVTRYRLLFQCEDIKINKKQK